MVTSPYSNELSIFDLLSCELLSRSSFTGCAHDVELCDIANCYPIYV